eukprot:jgi/Tetstr1/451233/TSEL_038269.t1
MAAAASVAEAWGGIDHLVNNAGIIGRLMGLGDLDPDELDRILAINLKSVFYATAAFVAYPRATEGRSVVMLSSIAARTGGMVGNMAYAASKGAIATLTKSFAKELAPHTRVNGLAPGIIDTEIQQASLGDADAAAALASSIPLERLGDPSEVAEAALWLLSPSSSYQGFEAVYMTGFGATAATLGMPDLGLMTQSEMVDQARRMVQATTLPVIADADTGYGGLNNLYRTIKDYAQIGVAAIHLEDQALPKRCGQLSGVQLISAKEHVARISAALAANAGSDMMIIARTDALGVHGIEEAIARANAYADAGADMVFVDGVKTIEQARVIGASVKGPKKLEEKMMKFGYLLAATTALVAIAPSAALAQDERVRWRMHSSYAESMPVAGATAFKIGETIDLISGGNFDIRVFEPGALVNGTQYYDAVSEGAIQAAYGSPGFNVGKNSAYAFFAAIPFGPGAGEMLGWLYHGGGLEIARELYAQDNLYMMPCGILPPESGGWFQKEITSVEDLDGLKMRFLGLGAKVMERFGVSTQLLAPGEIYQALELGTLDATEQSVPAIDRGLGFYQIAKYNYFPGWHQQSTVQELLVNLDSWNQLSDAQQHMLEMACKAATVDQFAGGEAGQFEVMQQNEADGVQNMRWPDEMLEAFRSAWEEVIAQETSENPDSDRVWQSLEDFREDYTVWGDRAYLD